MPIVPGPSGTASAGPGVRPRPARLTRTRYSASAAMPTTTTRCCARPTGSAWPRTTSRTRSRSCRTCRTCRPCRIGVQQSFVNFQFLARLLKSPNGFASDPAFRAADGRPAFATGDVAYWGRSQGGIFGGGADRDVDGVDSCRARRGRDQLLDAAHAQRRLRRLLTDRQGRGTRISTTVRCCRT